MSPVARSALSLLLASSLALAPMRAAFAGGDDGGAVTVWTKDGGMFRGEIVERVPNDHITIKLATGETKRIEWKDVERDSVGTPTLPAAPAAPADAPEPRPTRKSSPEASPQGVRVHLTGDAGLRLIRQTGISDFGSSAGGRAVSGTVAHFEIVCYAPCDLVVPRGGDYHVVADGKRGSAAFVLDGESRSIDARLGSSTGYVAGSWSLSLGLGSLLTAGLLYWVESSREPLTTYDWNTGAETKEPKSYGFAWACLGVGALLTTIGIAALASNQNDVRVDGHAVAARKPSSDFAWTPTGFVF